jgi:hypothetical protein
VVSGSGTDRTSGIDASVIFPAVDPARFVGLWFLIDRKTCTKALMNKNDSSRSTLQLIWGIALVMAGVGVFIRIPQVMPRVEQIITSPVSLWIIRFCFILMGILLVGGGMKKVIHHFRSSSAGKADR